MSDRPWVMAQTKRDTLVLLVGGFGMGLTNSHSKNLLLRKLNKGKMILIDRPKLTAGW
jgi:Na+-transporting NADH:ubiquinone oxidoreductase subunit NqrF